VGTKGDKSLLLFAVPAPEYFLHRHREIIVTNAGGYSLISIKCPILSLEEGFLPLGRKSH
jgi:hypothetical protein